jgi:predicted GNAT superfamily acetyltransferase
VSRHPSPAAVADDHEAGAAPIVIRPLSTPDERRRCVQLQSEVWGPDFSELVPERVLGLAQRLGGILSGAFDERDQLVGFVFGLTGVAAGKVVHWSDMLAVRAGTRNRGIGEALKRHQRARLLGQGVASVQWTFEPLESRNAHINFAHLGVIVREYVRDFYGDSVSPLHGEIGTDRIIAEWPIASDRVSRRLSGAFPPPTLDDVAGAPVINPVRAAGARASKAASGRRPRSGAASADGQAGEFPACHAPDLDRTEPLLRLAVPSRIQELKRADPDLARAWRHATRSGFEHYLRRGYVASEFVRADAVGYYVLDAARGGSDA